MEKTAVPYIVKIALNGQTEPAWINHGKSTKNKYPSHIRVVSKVTQQVQQKRIQGTREGKALSSVR